jgi:alpha-tubulin suppressor-like RCC1 family protein
VLRALGKRRRVTPVILAAAAAAVIAGAPGPAAEAATPIVYTFPRIPDTPTPMPGLPAGVTQVAGGPGANFALALLPGGVVSAWGLNSDTNSSGELGDGTTTNHTAPAPVQGLSGITQIAAGGHHGLAIGAAGAMWTWGDNTDGQLGDQTTTNRLTPVRLAGPTSMIQVAGGLDYSLGLRSDGTVWSWGGNESGQLGDGTTVQRSKPEEIPGLTHIIQISAGSSSSFALRSDGTLFAWGYNFSGELGDGTTTNRLSPEQVPGLTGVTAVSAGAFSTLAIVGPSHTIYGWGDNDLGEIGDGTEIDRSSPTPTSLSGVTAIDGGVFQSAAIRSDGSLWEWGDQILTPTAQTSLAGVTQVALGDDIDLVIAQPPAPPPAPATAIVPNLRGDTTARAGSALQAAGLVLGGVGSVVDNSCNNIGTVLSQSPAAGATQPIGSAVSITIGTKPKKPCP